MKYFRLLQKKSSFVSSRKQPSVPSDYDLWPPVKVQISSHVFKWKRDCKTNAEMGKCKTKTILPDFGIFTRIFSNIQAYLDIIRHVQAYSGIIQAYSGLCATLAYSELWYIQNPGIFKTRGIFRTLVYPKLWYIQNEKYIQNPGLLFRTLGYSELEAYSEPCQTSTMECFEKQVFTVKRLCQSLFYNKSVRLTFLFPGCTLSSKSLYRI